MSEIQTETVDAQAESVFSFDLFNKVDEEEIDELDAEVEATVVESETKALPSRPSGLSVLESAPDRAPYELDQEALFRELIAQHQRRLYRFVIKYIDHPDDAADITQQAFVEAARTMVRNYLRKMIEQDLYDLPVLSYQELTPEVNIQPLARVEL
jgi:flagellar biosynthesis component FlhA